MWAPLQLPVTLVTLITLCLAARALAYPAPLLSSRQPESCSCPHSYRSASGSPTAVGLGCMQGRARPGPGAGQGGANGQACALPCSAESPPRTSGLGRSYCNGCFFSWALRRPLAWRNLQASGDLSFRVVLKDRLLELKGNYLIRVAKGLKLGCLGLLGFFDATFGARRGSGSGVCC